MSEDSEDDYRAKTKVCRVRQAHHHSQRPSCKQHASINDGQGFALHVPCCCNPGRSPCGCVCMLSLPGSLPPLPLRCRAGKALRTPTCRRRRRAKRRLWQPWPARRPNRVATSYPRRRLQREHLVLTSSEPMAGSMR